MIRLRSGHGRFAGLPLSPGRVFLMLSGAGRTDGEERCAILDDLQNKEQILASENEQFGAVRVVRVEPDRVVLSGASGEETIFLAAGTLETGRKCRPLRTGTSRRSGDEPLREPRG